jgi:hypothetical protein
MKRNWGKWLIERGNSVVDNLLWLILVAILAPIVYVIADDPEEVLRKLTLDVPLWSLLTVTALLAVILTVFFRIWKGIVKERRAHSTKEPASFGIWTENTRSGIVFVERDGLGWKGSVTSLGGKVSLESVSGPHCPKCHTELTDYADHEWFGLPAALGTHCWRCPSCGFKLDCQKSPDLSRKEVRNILENRIERHEVGKMPFEIQWI